MASSRVQVCGRSSVVPGPQSLFTMSVSARPWSVLVWLGQGAGQAGRKANPLDVSLSLVLVGGMEYGVRSWVASLRPLLSASSSQTLPT